MAGVLSPFLTVEEAYLLAAYLKGLNPANVLAMGPVPTQRHGRHLPARPDQGPDRRHQLRGPAALHHPRREVPQPPGSRGDPEHFQGVGHHLRGAVAEGCRRRIPGALRHRPTRSIPGSTRPPAASLRSKVGFLVVQDTIVTPLAHLADVVLAGATFAEKAGCYVNADGRLQYAGASLPPREGSLPDLDLFAILLHRPGGPVRSGEVLAELAEAVPAFAVARGGNVPRWERCSVRPRRPTDATRRRPFTDTWYVPQGAARYARRWIEIPRLVRWLP